VTLTGDPLAAAAGPQGSAREALAAYWASLLALGRARLARTSGLVLLGALLDSMGIVLIIPLLELIFANQTSNGRAARLFAPVIEAVGARNGLVVLLVLAVVLMALRGLVACTCTAAAERRLAQHPADRRALHGADDAAVAMQVLGLLRHAMVAQIGRRGADLPGLATDAAGH